MARKSGSESHGLAAQCDEQRIDAIFAGIDQCSLPGATVGISIGGRTVYRKGFGLASMELPVLLSPSIRMRMYSVTKHFTCLAYLLLCEEGRAHVDDPIGEFLPELNRVAHQITPRQLMGNISGLRDVHDVNWIFSGTGRPVPSADLLSMYRDIDDTNAPPGTAWIYNNGGFLLLTAIIERITDSALEDVLCERIFSRSGMYDSLLRRLDTDFVPNSATMHTTRPEGGYDRSYLGAAMAGEGGLVSTVDDMLRWLAHMDAPVIGSAETWATMKAPQRLANGTSTGYGLGLITATYRGVETLFHTGGGMGANAQMLKVPAAGLDIVVMVNRYDLSSMLLAYQILDACIPGLASIPQPLQYVPACGTFRSPRTRRIIRLLAKDGQQMAWIDNYDIPLEADKGGVLWPTGKYTYLRQSVTLLGDRETPDAIRFSDFGNVDELEKVRPGWQPDSTAIIGRFRSDATGTEVSIADSGSGPRLHTTGRFGATSYELEGLAPGAWWAKPRVPFMSGVLSFGEDAESFEFSNARTWALPFRRISR